MDKFNEARQMLMKELQVGAANLHDESNAKDIYDINKYGMLTIDSQQGLIERGNVPKDRALHAKVHKELDKKYRHSEVDEDIEYSELLKRVDHTYRQRGGTFKKGIVSKEKAYLVGFLPIAQAYQLVQYLDQVDNIVAWLVVTPEKDDDSGDFSSTWVTYTPTTQSGEYSRSDAFPLYGITQLNTQVNRFSQNEYGGERVKSRPQDDKLFALVSIQDARFGHSASAPGDGLFAVVKRALKAIQKNIRK